MDKYFYFRLPHKQYEFEDQSFWLQTNSKNEEVKNGP